MSLKTDEIHQALILNGPTQAIKILHIVLCILALAVFVWEHLLISLNT